jgi:ATP-dependent DNA helicase RecQ
MTEGNVSSEDWLRTSKERHQRALRESQSPNDRLALLRSLARLHHGRLDLTGTTLALSAGETDGLARHGLALEGGILRIVDEQYDDRAPAGVWQAEALDAGSRRPYAAASPDAPLLRYTTHTAYRMAAQKAAVRALLTMPPGGGLMVSMPTVPRGPWLEVDAAAPRYEHDFVVPMTTPLLVRRRSTL